MKYKQKWHLWPPRNILKRKKHTLSHLLSSSWPEYLLGGLTWNPRAENHGRKIWVSSNVVYYTSLYWLYHWVDSSDFDKLRFYLPCKHCPSMILFLFKPLSFCYLYLIHHLILIKTSPTQCMRENLCSSFNPPSLALEILTRFMLHQVIIVLISCLCWTLTLCLSLYLLFSSRNLGGGREEQIQQIQYSLSGRHMQQRFTDYTTMQCC